MIETLSGLFSMVLANTWLTALIIPLVLVIRTLVGNRLSPRWRHLLWLLVFARLLLPAAWLPASSLSVQNIAAAEKPLEQVETAVNQDSSVPVQSNAGPEVWIDSPQAFAPVLGFPAKHPPSSFTWRDIGALVWFAGMLFGAGTILVAQFVLTRRIASGAAPVPTSLRAAYDETCLQLEISRRPRLVFSNAVGAPLLLGFIRPCIVLPAANLEAYSKAELGHMFAHEIAHVRRGDAWAHLLQLTALCVHWFNPLVWLACRAAQLDRELAADEWALAHLQKLAPEDYGQTLLRLIAAQSGPRMSPATLGIVENFQQLKRRLNEIAGFSPRSRLDSIAGLGLVVAAAFAVLSTRAIASSLGALKDAIYDRNGVVLVENRTSATPHYVYKALAAPLLGLDARETPAERRGIQGMLHGSPAASIQLTIDARVQSVAEQAFRDSKFTRGAVVVMDPNSGDVLALVSAPSFDPNEIRSPEELEALSEKWSTPLYDRALHGMPPASTFKLVVALAGLASGKATPQTQFDCPASIQIGDHVFHNADNAPSGRLDLTHAIITSSDTYFYQYGLTTGIDAIDEMAKRAGFGQRWDVLNGGDEDAGIVPGPGWMKEHVAWLERTHNRTDWTDAQTANASIGQGYVLATPLQVSAFVGAIANGGTVYHPRLYRTIEMKNGQTIQPPEGKIFGTLGVRPEDLKAIQQAMLDVVEADPGTGREARIPGLHIAGKTGSAETYFLHDKVIQREHATWFTCYAPFKKPRYVVTVLVQGGTWGGTDGAPIAKQILATLCDADKSAQVHVHLFDPIITTFKPAPLAQ